MREWTATRGAGSLAVGHVIDVAVGDRGPIGMRREEDELSLRVDELLESQGHATRSTFTFSRLIHFRE